MLDSIEPPRYKESTLITVIRKTKDIDDLCRLGKLLSELQEAGDLDITPRMEMEINITMFQHIYGKRIQDNNN